MVSCTPSNIKNKKHHSRDLEDLDLEVTYVNRCCCDDTETVTFLDKLWFVYLSLTLFTASSQASRVREGPVKYSVQSFQLWRKVIQNVCNDLQCNLGNTFECVNCQVHPFKHTFWVLLLRSNDYKARWNGKHTLMIKCLPQDL